MRLTNALGQQVRQAATLANQPELLLDLRDQAPGLYQLTVETAGATTRQRLVVAPKQRVGFRLKKRRKAAREPLRWGRLAGSSARGLSKKKRASNAAA